MKKYILPLLASLLCLSACDDWLNLSPQDELTPDSFFKTETDLKMFSNSFYNSAFSGTYFRNQSDIIIESGLSDNLRGGNSREVPNSGGGWSFTFLRKINNLIEYAGNCPDQHVRDEYIALARFFRAYYYYTKVIRFGDYPWIDHVLGSDDEDLYYPRDSRETVLTHMVEDIDAAIAGLPETSSLYRVNRYTALAVKARMSTDAIAGETILAVDYDNTIGIYHNATWYGIKSSAGRAGFTKKFVDSYLMKDGSRFTDREGWRTMPFTEEVKDRDPRLAQTIRTPGYRREGKKTELPDGPEFENSITGFQTIKYVQPMELGADGYDHSFSDMPVIRFGEVVLIYAEAKAELGTLTQEDLDKSLNLLRDRVAMPHLDLAAANANPDPYLGSAEYGYRNVTGPNKGVILEIRRERTIELAQEGDKRYFDLMRWKEGKCIDQGMYGMYFPGPGEYDLDGDGTAEYCLYSGTKPSTSAKYVLEIGKDIVLSPDGLVDPVAGIAHVFDEGRDYLYPVPINERSLNPKLSQNPGWNDGLDF